MSDVAARALEPISTARGWVTKSVNAAPVAALKRITEVLRIIREPFRLHLRPTMGLDRLECRPYGTRHRARAGSRWQRGLRRPWTSSPWSRPPPPQAPTGPCCPKCAPSPPPPPHTPPPPA